MTKANPRTKPIMALPTLAESELGQLLTELQRLQDQVAEPGRRIDQIKDRVKVLLGQVLDLDKSDVDVTVDGLPKVARVAHTTTHYRDTNALAEHWRATRTDPVPTHPQDKVALSWVAR